MVSTLQRCNNKQTNSIQIKSSSTHCNKYRLELMGAMLGLKLVRTIVKALEMDMEKVTFWTESSNVLWWIRGHSR